MIKLLIYIFCMIVIAGFIYGSGNVMIFISNKYSKYEWVNSVIACLDIFAIFLMVVLVLQIIMLLIPYILLLSIIIFTVFIIEILYKGFRKIF